MLRIYSEDEKIKYVRGFKNSTLPILEYSSKMKIDYLELKQWLKEYKEVPSFGVIDVEKLSSKESVETSESPLAVNELRRHFIYR